MISLLVGLLLLAPYIGAQENSLDNEPEYQVKQKPLDPDISLYLPDTDGDLTKTLETSAGSREGLKFLFWFLNTSAGHRYVLNRIFSVANMTVRKEDDGDIALRIAQDYCKTALHTTEDHDDTMSHDNAYEDDGMHDTAEDHDDAYEDDGTHDNAEYYDDDNAEDYEDNGEMAHDSTVDYIATENSATYNKKIGELYEEVNPPSETWLTPVQDSESELRKHEEPLQAGSIRGIPGVHFPNYYDIPITSFTCADKKYIPGFYADLETGCQVFHVCWPHRKESFLCPVGTVFNQAILACDYWYSVECSLAPLFFEVNARLTEAEILTKNTQTKEQAATYSYHKKPAAWHTNKELYTSDSQQESTPLSSPDWSQSYSHLPESEYVTKESISHASKSQADHPLLSSSHYPEILNFLPVKSKVTTYPDSKATLEHGHPKPKRLVSVKKPHVGALNLKSKIQKMPIVKPKVTPYPVSKATVEHSHLKPKHVVSVKEPQVGAPKLKSKVQKMSVAPKVKKTPEATVKAKKILPFVSKTESLPPKSAFAAKREHQLKLHKKPLQLQKVIPKFVVKPVTVKEIKPSHEKIQNHGKASVMKSIPLQISKPLKTYKTKAPLESEKEHKEILSGLSGKVLKGNILPFTRKVLVENHVKHFKSKWH